jgi:quinol monooxygenase YgiN
MVTLIARLIAKPGKEVLLAEECAKMRKIVREQEQGRLTYIPHVAADNPANRVLGKIR